VFWRISIFLLCLIASWQTNAQIIYSESFVLTPPDSAQPYRGSVSGSFMSQKQKDVFFQLNQRADFAMRIKHASLIVANNFDIIRNGDETVLSGGFAYAKLRRFVERKAMPEYFAQYQWFDIRGLDQRMVLGANMRFRLLHSRTDAFYVAAGAMLEYEKWNYTAVPDHRLPASRTPEEVLAPKWNVYASFDHDITKNILLDVGLYYQTRILPAFEYTRIANHLRVGWKVNRHIMLSGVIRVIYEYKPIVPVDTWWYRVSNELTYRF
jgi:hypothetical protein